MTSLSLSLDLSLSLLTSLSFLAPLLQDASHSYSHRDFEQVMFHHNITTRTTYFEHSIKGEGLDHCYDCSAEIHVLAELIRHTQPDVRWHVHAVQSKG